MGSLSGLAFDVAMSTFCYFSIADGISIVIFQCLPNLDPRIRALKRATCLHTGSSAWVDCASWREFEDHAGGLEFDVQTHCRILCVFLCNCCLDPFGRLDDHLS